MDVFAKRLCAAMKKKDIRPADLAEITGIGKSAISQYMNGAFRPKQVRTEKIAAALGVSVAYLMGYSDYMERLPDTDIILGTDNPSISLPIIGEVAAGFGHEAIEEETGDYEQIPVSWLHGRPKEDFFVLRVKGASMYPAYQEGDRVLVRRKSSVESGTVAVVLYDATEATLKKVKYKPGEDWMDLIPLNPEYAPRRVENHALEQCRILGEAIRLIRVIK